MGINLVMTVVLSSQGGAEMREDGGELYCLCCHDKMGIPIYIAMTVVAMVPVPNKPYSFCGR